MTAKSCPQNGAAQAPRVCSSRARWAAERAATRQSLRSEISSATARTSPNTRWAAPRRVESPRHKPPASEKARSPASSRLPPDGDFGGKDETESLEQCSRLGHLDVIEKLPRSLNVRRRANYHGPLLNRRIQIFRNAPGAAFIFHRGGNYERKREDPGVRVSGFHELRRLRNIFAEHEPSLDGIIDTRFPQGFLRSASIRRMFRIGNGDFLHGGIAQPGKAFA